MSNKGYRVKNSKILINPTYKEILEREPLVKFSYYLSGRNNSLISKAKEIISLLDKGFGADSDLLSEGIDSTLIGKASDLTWYWTLGAYEVVRTMDQSKKCFSPEFMQKIGGLKKELSKVRMPAAKMEKKDQKKVPVTSDRSPDFWDKSNKDLLVGDPDAPISASYLFKKYIEVMESLDHKNIKPHEKG